jgi:DNA-binding LacI/PurR family transcriptional regulator
MRFEAITIKDIAKALGLSTSTVSRALRDSYEISPKTKEIVIKYAKENNYRPNPIALSLKEKRSSSIGVVVVEIANSFFSQAINGIESIAHEKGYNVIIAQNKEQLEKEESALQFLASRSVDGILLSVSSQTSNFDHIKKLYDRSMPMVSFDCVVDFDGIHKVIVDNTKAAFDGTEHLISKGFKNIACVASSSNLSITKERVKGYLEALKKHNLPSNESNIIYINHGGVVAEEINVAMDLLMGKKNKPDALIVCSDRITTNVMRYCQQNKIHIPNQLGLIGFSNLDLTDLLTPSLSVLRQPAYEMGRMAADLLIKMIESKRPVTEFETVVLTSDLIERESSVPKKK